MLSIKPALNTLFPKVFKTLLIVVIGMVIAISHSGLLYGQNQTAKNLPSGIGYWEYLPPDYNTNTDKYPVLFFFHGLGERGNGTTELYKVLRNGPPKHIQNGYQFPFIVISPQLYSNYGSWSPVFADQVVEYVKTQLRIDTDRIYISGLSLGGGGAWYYVQKFPEKVAAVAPICGNWNSPSTACEVAAENVPVWAFHGDSDPTVSVNRTINMINALNACDPAINPEALMTIYPNVAHNSWSRAYRTDNSLHTPNVYEWMMQYSNSTVNANAGPDLELILPSNSINITGTGAAGASPVTFLWEKSAGPAATLSNAGTATLSLTGLVEGVYVFKLTVTDDKGNTASDNVQITVIQANQPPTADAGTDKTIKLPTNSITIYGNGSDDDGSISTYLWNKTSGSAASMSGINSATLSLTNLTTGIYIFSLTVTDNDGATSKDEVTVTVLDADNLPPVANAGSDISVNLPTNTATVAGFGSDADGTVSLYSWTKVAGPAATLTNTNLSTLTVSDLVEGIYTFRLTVTDDKGATGTDEMTIVVSAANQSPTVFAGNDITITLPTAQAAVSGTASDVDGAVVSYLWEQVSGPSTANIVNPTVSATNIGSLTLEGNYIFSLLATDDDGASALDKMTITVNPSPPANVEPVANSGADKFITLPTNSVTINGSGSDSDGTISTYLWTRLSGPTATMSGQNTQTLQLTDLLAGDYQFRLTVTDNDGASDFDDITVIVSPEIVNESPVANAGPDKVLTLPGNTTTLNGSGTDPDGTVTSFAWTKTSGPAATLSGENSATLVLSNLLEGIYTFELIVTDDDGAIDTDIVEVSVNAANSPPVVSAGPNITITLPDNSVTMTGVADDPDGTIASVAWSQVSGPSTATLSGAGTVTLTASTLVAGLYTFKFTSVDNDGASSEDDVNVTVNEAVNQSPVASAGANKAITLPQNSITLTGSATDSDGTIASVTWSQISGPSTATLINANNLTLTVSGLLEGIYTFQLTITDDDGASDFDRVNVRVNPAATNSPPIADAGPNKNITLPANTVILYGSGQDSDGSISTYLWTKVSGPASTLQNASTATLTASNLIEGNYIFRLSVTDNMGSMSSDDVSVSVQPATVNQSPTANAGPDITLTLPANMTNISGSGSDPDGSIVSYNWVQLTGTTAALSNGSTATLTVSGLLAGVYTFELTVTDNSGALSTDIVQVRVNAETVNQIPIADAGPDRTLTLPTNSIALNGSGSDADGSIVSYRWTKISGPAVTLGNMTTADLSMTDLVVGSYLFRLAVTDNRGATASDDVRVFVIAETVNQAPSVSAGPDKTIKLPLNSTSLIGSASDPDGTVTLVSWTVESGTGAVISNRATVSTFVSSLAEGNYKLRLTVTDDDGASSYDETTITVLPATANFAPLADAGTDISIKLPTNSVMLFGAGNDADGTIVAYAWTKQSGPAVTIQDADTSRLLLSDMTAGSYYFRLKVTDDKGATGIDDVKIDVLPTTINNPPVVNAGPNLSIQLPDNSITVTGTATDDDGAIAAVAWTQLSGPSGISMTNATTGSLTLDNLTRGSYKFSFSATDDGGLTLSDEMTLTVLEEEALENNLPPAVDAGADQTLQMPESTTVLEALASDPDDIVTSFYWTQLEGPTTVVIDNPDSSLVNLSGLAPGRYSFQVEVTDLSGAKGSDMVTILVLNSDEMGRPHKIFSPNNDGIDDYWVIDNAEALSDCTTIIFNRRGEAVYEITGYQNNWDGTENGKPLPEGAYYYVIKCGSDKNTLSGSVTIIR